jgi:glycosyltransferase involved in cell wall biosynthesis
MTGVAIVIPMLNEAAGLPRLLRSLAALEPTPTEVLAVDGGSADASVAIAEAAGLLVIRHDSPGRAAATPRCWSWRRRICASASTGSAVPASSPRGNHLRSAGRRLGRAAGELDLPQGRSTLGARLSQRAGAALPRRTLNRAPAQIACSDAVVDQPLQEGLIGARTRASAQRPQIRVLEPGGHAEGSWHRKSSLGGRGSAPCGSVGPVRRFSAVSNC